MSGLSRYEIRCIVDDALKALLDAARVNGGNPETLLTIKNHVTELREAADLIQAALDTPLKEQRDRSITNGYGYDADRVHRSQAAAVKLLDLIKRGLP